MLQPELLIFLPVYLLELPVVVHESRHPRFGVSVVV